jgi:FkbM family methyltransferase
MIWFGAMRFLTSSLRWILGLLMAPILKRWVLLAPPFLRTQYLLSLKPLRSIKFRIGSYFDWATIHEVFSRNEYSTEGFAIHENVNEHYRHVATKGTPLILDLGANIGISASFFSLCYPGSKVIAVEPASQNISLLTRNTAQIPGITVLHGAVGSSSGEVSLFDSGAGNNAFRTFGSESQVLETVLCYSIQDLVDAHSDATPFLLKIDVEGAEKELFSANFDWIDSFKVIVIETHDWMLPGEAISSNLLNALGGRNRDLIFRGENLFSIRVD